jgi:hypothetical protein
MKPTDNDSGWWWYKNSNDAWVCLEVHRGEAKISGRRAIPLFVLPDKWGDKIPYPHETKATPEPPAKFKPRDIVKLHSYQAPWDGYVFLAAINDEVGVVAPYIVSPETKAPPFIWWMADMERVS